MRNNLLLSQLRSRFNFNAMIRVKAGRPLVNHFRNVVVMIGGHVNRSVIKVILTFVFKCYRIHRTSGPLYQVNFLKAQYVNLQQALGGSPCGDLGLQKARFARNNQGLPRIIPAIHRSRIRAGDTFIVRQWQSLFSQYRVIDTPYKLKQTTITAPVKSQSKLDSFNKEYEIYVANVFLPLLLREFRTEWLERTRTDLKGAQRMLEPKPFEISKSTPVHPSVRSTSLVGLWAAITTWAASPLLPDFKRFLAQTSDRRATSFYDLFEAWIYRLNYISSRAISADLGSHYRPTGWLGKLGFKEEAAGKQRVFAQVDAFTQWALEPLHREMFNILGEIPQDGTFDQTAPVKRLLLTKRPGAPLFSLDQSAATDRQPVSSSVIQLKAQAGEEYGNLWRKILCDRDFHYSYKGTSGSQRYAVGQPMGALSSWSFGLSLFHHSLVQLAAHRARRSHMGTRSYWFSDYALLGDDIVIADTRVKVEYQLILDQLGVECSQAKSQVSRNGSALEFAKRFYWLGQDCSPVAQFDELATRFSFGSAQAVASRRELTQPMFQTILGYGFHAKSRMTAAIETLPRRQGNYILGHRLMTEGESVFLNGMPDFTYESLADRNVTRLLAWVNKSRTSEEWRAAEGLMETIGEQGGYSPPYDDNVVWWEGKYADLSPKMMFVDFIRHIILRTHLHRVERAQMIGRGFSDLSHYDRFFTTDLMLTEVNARSIFSFKSERVDKEPLVNPRPTEVVRFWRHMHSQVLRDVRTGKARQRDRRSQ